MINFVGGWMDEGCRNASKINGTLFKRSGMFPHSTLWLYGNHEPLYSLDHSRANFAAFQAAGGKGSFFDFGVPGGNGHLAMFSPPLWTDRPTTSIAISTRLPRWRNNSGTLKLHRSSGSRPPKTAFTDGV